MLFRKARILREQENEHGAAGAEGDGKDVTGQPAEGPEDKSINSQAKDLPWVKALIASKAELDRFKTEKAESQSKIEREKAEAEGRYADALKMETDKAAKTEAQYSKKIKELSLKSELASAGFRPESLKIFGDKFKTGDEELTAERLSEVAKEFATELKSDEANAWLLVDTKQRVPKKPAPAGGFGKGQTVEPSWITSDDPDKRSAAIEQNRKAFWSKQKR